jgi:N6-L-threonylcarbamoyladenine synthase
LLLAIESSCDETAAAVLAGETEVLSSVVASQLEVHSKYGGVVPELASREHLRAIVPVVREALHRADITFHDLQAVAATSGPGLAGSLLVGLTYAKAIALAAHIPLITVNHIEGHIHAVLIEGRQRGTPIELPAIALVVSGGHTHLFEATTGNRYRLLGRTRDDAAGEAFDKVAKLLGFGYPGGPVVDKLAAQGNPRAIRFTTAKMKGNMLDFSFSGIKTAVLRWVEAHPMADEIAARRDLLRTHLSPTVEEWLAVTPQATLDLLASFQHHVVTELIGHAEAAASEVDGVRSLVISGGVACNSGLRAAANNRVAGLPVFFPTPSLSTDNAVMIAAAAWPKLQRREFAELSAKAEPSLTLAT